MDTEILACDRSFAQHDRSLTSDVDDGRLDPEDATTSIYNRVYAPS